MKIPQYEEVADRCKCRRCHKKQNIRITPEYKPVWRCEECRLVQKWVPSEEYEKHVILNY